MKRLCAINFWVLVSLVVATMAAPALANTGPGPMTSTRAYFVRAYAMVIAGEALADQCKMLRTWQRQSLKRHAKTLRAKMVQRLPVADVNQARRIARDLVDRHSDCEASARSIIDDSLFAAHGLVYSRAEGTEPEEITPELKEFLTWAKAEMETAKPKTPAVVAAKKKAKPKRKVGAGFKRYRTTVEAYYLERRCKHLSRANAKAYWKLVTRAHKRAVAQFGAARVSAVQRDAARSARRKARRCGRGTKAQVVAGFGLIRKKPKARSLRASLTLTSRSHDDFRGR